MQKERNMRSIVSEGLFGTETLKSCQQLTVSLLIRANKAFHGRAAQHDDKTLVNLKLGFNIIWLKTMVYYSCFSELELNCVCAVCTFKMLNVSGLLLNNVQ